MNMINKLFSFFEKKVPNSSSNIEQYKIFKTKMRNTPINIDFSKKPPHLFKIESKDSFINKITKALSKLKNFILQKPVLNEEEFLRDVLYNKNNNAILISGITNIHPYRVNVDTGIPAFMHDASNLDKFRRLGETLHSAPSIDPRDVDVLVNKRSILLTRMFSELFQSIRAEIFGPRIKSLLSNCSKQIKPILEKVLKMKRRIPFPEAGNIT